MKSKVSSSLLHTQRNAKLKGILYTTMGDSASAAEVFAKHFFNVSASLATTEFWRLLNNLKRPQQFSLYFAKKWKNYKSLQSKWIIESCVISFIFCGRWQMHTGPDVSSIVWFYELNHDKWTTVHNWWWLERVIRLRIEWVLTWKLSHKCY